MAAVSEPSVRQEVRQEQPRYEAIREEQRREAKRLEEALRAEEPRIEQPPQPREEPVRPREEPARMEEPVRMAEPQVDSRALLESSGLVMIETDRAKAQYTPQSDLPQPLGRPRRERPRSAQEEELQQVETRK